MKNSILMNKTEHLLYHATLKNNCPECFATEGIALSFYQEESESIFKKKATKTIASQLKCENCNTYIYPVQYTDDIERVHAYHYKLALPLKRKSKWKPLAFVILIAAICIIAAAVYAILHWQQ